MIKTLTRFILGFKVEVECTLEVSNTVDSLHAHVALDGIREMKPGDQLLVHGAPAHITHGETRVFRRKATIKRAGFFQIVWMKLMGDFRLRNLERFNFSKRAAL